jgi:predicted Zn-dependent protease
LGTRWFTRGVTDLNARRYDKAVADFRSALLYARDNYNYQLNLAEALIGLGRTAEAYSYLVNLWEREPENGLVNLALARIAAQRGQTEQGCAITTMRFMRSGLGIRKQNVVKRGWS